MGGKSSAVTVGYKYLVGIHMVLCHGPIDFISQIKIDKRLAWSGNATSGKITIDKPGLFGGEEREGGVQGDVDILLGEPTQNKNNYLQGQLGTDIPAFRGVVSAILRQVYVGMNPYLKNWSFRAQRIDVKSNGEAQWHPSRAAIGTMEDAALYFVMDISNSMAVVSANGKTRLENLKSSLIATINPLLNITSFVTTIDIMVVAFAGGVVSIIKRSATPADIQEILDWIEVRDYSDVPNGTTEFDLAFAPAVAFFNGSGSKTRISLFITDGQATGGSEVPAGAIFDGIANLAGYAVNIDLVDTSDIAYVDNTPEDGLPVIAGEDTDAMVGVLAAAAYSDNDMNPAHIIRECLTDSVWGMGYLESDIDNDSFIASADTLFSESMGISLLWDRQIPIEDFINEIIRHINATLYVGNISGKFILKLIRDDYNESTLLILNESNISKVSNYSRKDPHNAVNSVSVTYWDAETAEDASITVENIALSLNQNQIINTTIQYPGFTNSGIASRAAARDLKTLSSPILTCTIEANREASEINIGSVFKLVWPDYHDGYIIMRVHKISFGDGKKNKIKITASEDIFALPSTLLVNSEPPGWVDPGGVPLVPPIQLVQEALYYEAVFEAGQAEVDSQLASTPEIGYLGIAANQPENGLNAAFWVNSTGQYEQRGILDFAPSAKIATDITLEDTEWSLTTANSLDLVDVGTYAQIGIELVRIDAIDVDLNLLTVGRAILDTIPIAYSLGEDVIFRHNFTETDGVEYVDGETIYVKVLTNSSQGQLDLASGVESSVTFDSRAIRPYRPANLRVNNLLNPDFESYPDYPVDITWVERNRIQETSSTFLSWVDDTITPEVGIQYYLVIEALDDSYVSQGTVTTSTQTATSYQLTEAIIGATWAIYPFMKATITTQRDGYDSWQSPYLIFRGPFQKPQNLEVVFIAANAPIITTTLLVP